MLTHGLSDQGANGLPRLSPPYKGQLSLVWGWRAHNHPAPDLQYPHAMLRLGLHPQGSDGAHPHPNPLPEGEGIIPPKLYKDRLKGEGTCRGQGCGACLRSRTEGFDLVRPRRHWVSRASLIVVCRSASSHCYALRCTILPLTGARRLLRLALRGSPPSQGTTERNRLYHPERGQGCEVPACAGTTRRGKRRISLRR